jgi:signal transduction histidine kinase
VEFPFTSSDGEQNHQVGRGWVVYTFIRISNIPIGVFVNDTAITHLPPNEVVQESVALYCSLLGNIIERMRAEDAREVLIAELEAKNAELEQFTYTVSHDLKSPLITIRGFLGFLEKDAQTGNLDRLRIDLTRIDEAAVKMQQLLDQLLELSRIGRLINPPEEILFEIIARDAVELVEGRISAGGVRVHIAANLPLVNGDRARLVEVITNLLDNAVKFMGKQPEPRIEIGTLGPDQDGKVVLYVKDNGIGIDPQYYERIFGLFNKLDPHSEGIGVGLALVKRIIEVHGGRIWIESEGIGHGATFYFTLPGKMVTVPPLCKGGG